MSPGAVLLAAVLSGPAPDPALDQAVEALRPSVERLHGKGFEREPRVVRAPEPSRQAAASRRVEGWVDAARLAARGRAWSDLGLGDSGTPRRLLELLALDLAGVTVEPGTERLLVSRGVLGPEDFQPGPAPSLLEATGLRPGEPVLAHGLVHALLPRAPGPPGEVATDPLLAWAAWAEGEANRVAVRLLVEASGLQGEPLPPGLDPSSVLEGALLPADLGDLPPADRALGEFIYKEGFARAAERDRRGAGPGRPPASTRDLLHGARAEVPPVPDPSPPAGVDCLPADRDVLGEQGVIALVSIATGKDNLALLAGEGWAGDRLLRCEPADAPESGVTLWETRWDRAEDAEELAYALGRGFEARQGALQAAGRVARVTREGTAVRVRVAPAAVDRRLEAPPAPPSPTDRKPPTSAPSR